MKSRIAPIVFGFLILGLPLLLFLTLKEKDVEQETRQESVALNEYVRIRSPKPGETITSPLTVTGEARGYWYFEADFPVVLTDSEGRILAEHYAQAQGEWMTENFVPFVSTITFGAPQESKRGSLILHKANASGLPEHDDAVEILVHFH